MSPAFPSSSSSAGLEGEQRLVVDSGSEYGDINETNLTGEETLERIDVTALKIFPCCFLLFNLGYWIHFLLHNYD